MVDRGHLAEQAWMLSCGHVREFDGLLSYLWCPTCKLTKPVMRKAEAFEVKRV